MFTITLIGRPNVGKSTLFNRLVGGRPAIVTSVPGTTRDRREQTFDWNGRTFRIIDTGGLYSEETELFEAAIIRQCEKAMAESHLVWVIMDGREGLTLADESLFAWVRRVHPHVWVIVNKIDTPAHEERMADFYTLGAEQTFGISAESGLGIGDLLDRVVAFAGDTLSRGTPGADSPESLDQPEGRIAIVGRPNAGKSSLVNRLIGYERVIVSDIPGTTRDVVDVPLQWGERSWILMDTAGHKKRRRARNWPERVALIKMRQSIERADMFWLIIDAFVGVTRRDRQLAGWARDTGKALVIALNKWDRIPRPERTLTLDRARVALKFVAYAPIVPLSALTGEGLEAFLETVLEVWHAYNRRIPTGQLNRYLDHERNRILTRAKGRPIRIKYLTQVDVRPPTFVVFTNRPAVVQTDHLHPLKNWLRQEFNFMGTPIRVKCVDARLTLQS